jgi:hypothetical protein
LRFQKAINITDKKAFKRKNIAVSHFYSKNIVITPPSFISYAVNGSLRATNPG